MPETRAAGRGREKRSGTGTRVAGPGAVTFSVEAQAPMVEPELTEVGELHSLTDWQVSEASEEAELDEFCSGGWGGPHGGVWGVGNRIQTAHQQKVTINLKKKKMGAGKEKHAQRDKRIHRKGKDEKSRALGLLFPQSRTRGGFQALEKKYEAQQGPDHRTVSPQDPGLCASSPVLAYGRGSQSLNGQVTTTISSV